jgi:hypothetical protein
MDSDTFRKGGSRQLKLAPAEDQFATLRDEVSTLRIEIERLRAASDDGAKEIVPW